MSPDPFERLCQFISARFGLGFEHAKARLMRAIDRRWKASALPTIDDYVTALTTTPTNAELDSLLSELTVPETYFFRNADYFESMVAITQANLDAARSANLSPPPVRVWSAGCCTGEEPATIAMIFDARLPHVPLDIIGSDLTAKWLEIAQRGEYGQWSLRECPPEYRARYFRPLDGDRVALRPNITAGIRWLRHNLATDRFPAPELGLSNFDFVLCRNVLMYLTPETTTRVIAGFADSLRPGGWLFLGHSDWQFSHPALELVPTVGGSAFRKTATVAAPAPPFVPPAPPSRSSIALPLPLPPRGPDIECPPPPPQPVLPAPSAPAPALEDSAAHLATCLQLAREAGDRGEYGLALQKCREAERIAPFSAECCFIRAQIAIANDDRVLATDALRRTLYLDPAHLPAIFHLAIVQEIETGSPALALVRQLASHIADWPDEKHLSTTHPVTVKFIRAWVQQRLANSVATRSLP